MTKKKFIGCSGSPRTLAPIAEVPDTRYLSMRQHRISFQALGDGPTGQGLYGGCGWQRNGAAEM